jgi:proteasome assembly chaperone (PAC2) family protein
MENRQSIIFNEKPPLRHPYMVCGITGWVDGGEVATGGVRFLIKQFAAKKFAEMPSRRYHVNQVPGQISLRPIVKMEDGLIAEHHFPKNQFFYARNPGSDNDMIFFLGDEPNINWEEYASTLVDVAKQFETARIYLLVGVLDETPHTREPKVSCSCTSAELCDEMRKYNVTYSNYEGPGSFSTTMLYLCKIKGLEAVSFSARSTYYPEYNIVIPHNPKSIKAVLVRLNNLMRLNLNFLELNNEAKEFEGKLEFMRSQSPRFHAYVQELEKNYIEMPYEEPLEFSSDEAIKFAEDLLKKNQEQH